MGGSDLLVGRVRRKDHHVTAKSFNQCDMSTGNIGPAKTPSVALPKTKSRNLECPKSTHDQNIGTEFHRRPLYA